MLKLTDYIRKFSLLMHSFIFGKVAIIFHFWISCEKLIIKKTYFHNECRNIHAEYLEIETLSEKRLYSFSCWKLNVVLFRYNTHINYSNPKWKLNFVKFFFGIELNIIKSLDSFIRILNTKFCDILYFNLLFIASFSWNNIDPYQISVNDKGVNELLN